MHHLVALLAGCLLHPGPADDPCRVEREAQYEFLRKHPAAEIDWGDNGTIRRLKNPRGLVLAGGIEGFQVGQPARELIEKIGPALLATGREELRVMQVTRESELPARMPDRKAVVRLQEFIRGREVMQGSVNIALNEQTNEVTLLVAEFLPDRGLEHEPRLTAAEARARVEAELREIPYQEMNLTFQDAPARLAYSFEVWGASGGIGGVLVWAFPTMTSIPEQAEGSFGDLGVSAATGKITPRDNILRYWDR